VLSTSCRPRDGVHNVPLAGARNGAPLRAFPRIADGEGDTLTPDFTVLFDDGGGLAGEIARLARHENIINDPVDPLYLATHLWAKTFPTMAGDVARPARLQVRSADLAAELRDRYGGVLASDVDRALELLKTAKLGDRSTDGWVIAWEELRVPGEKDLAHALATRACRPPSRSALSRLEAPSRRRPPGQPRHRHCSDPWHRSVQWAASRPPP